MPKKGNDQGSRFERAAVPFRARRSVFVLFTIGLLLTSLAASAAAEGDSSQASGSGYLANGAQFGLPTQADVAGLISNATSADSPSPTNEALASELPHQDLGRLEAGELLQGVFEAQIQAPSAIFDELEVERFLSPNVAVVGSAGGAEGQADPGEGKQETPVGESGKAPLAEEDKGAEQISSDPVSPPSEEELSGHSLLEATVPLQVEGESGQAELVNLDLEEEDGELQPENPIVEVGIPGELGDAVQLPESEVAIELVGAPPERAPSTIGESVALYPNVARDTDLAVTPAPTGVETLTQIRSADAPNSETFRLDVPSGAHLEELDGGAQVTKGGEGLLSVLPPTAIDAAGAPVPVGLNVDGDEVTLTVNPASDAVYPILLDPLFQTYQWNNGSTKYWQDGICNSSFEYRTQNDCTYGEEWHSQELYTHLTGSGGFPIQNENQFWGSAPLYVAQGTPGLFIRSTGTVTAWDQGAWIYTVPRYFSDQESYGKRPTSYITKMTLSQVLWQAYSSQPSPYIFMGLWSTAKGEFVGGYYMHEGKSGHGTNDLSFQYQFKNEGVTDTQAGLFGVMATESGTQQNASAYAGSASIELADTDAPSAPAIEQPQGWASKEAVPIKFSAVDTGLGVSAVAATSQENNAISKRVQYGCVGVANAACPRKWNSAEAGKPQVTVDPSGLPNGLNKFNVVAEDPVGNKSTASVARIYVDHAAPTVSLTGSVTEMATLGTKRPSYLLKVNAADGTAASPQSGATKIQVEIDGGVVKKAEAPCPVENCSVETEWSIEAAKYTQGLHTIKVTAWDAAGNQSSPTELKITLNPSPPTLSLGGSATEQAALGYERPSYSLMINSGSQAGLEGAPAKPTYEAAFGKEGSANGQFSHPADVAVDAQGNLWVVDENGNRLEKFSRKGEFITALGSPGAGNGQFQRPTAVAVDEGGHLWVTDAGNKRVEEFSEEGSYIRQFGSAGTGNGQFAPSGGPEGIAVDPKGNVWVSDTYGARLEKFSPSGEFLKSVGTRGTGQGQLVEPTGMDIDNRGNIWVADWNNNKVVEFSEAGGFVRQFGSLGAGNGQFQHPDTVTLDSKGDVLVGDQSNHRIQEFNQSGQYVLQFGGPGSGEARFNFGYPMGIAAGPEGKLWITDPGNNRIQAWQIPTYLPSAIGSFGSYGIAAVGKMRHPSDVAVDASGNYLIADMTNGRIDIFNSAGVATRAINGEASLNRPSALALDPKGNIWVADAGNNRLVELSESGSLVRTVGSLGTANGLLHNPEGVAVDAQGNVWVADTGNNRLQEFSETGTFMRTTGTAGSGSGQLAEPAGIDVNSAGEIYVADRGNNRIAVFSTTGEFLRQFGSKGTGPGQLETPAGVALDPQGNVWVANMADGHLEEFTSNGHFLAEVGSQGTNPGQFAFAYPDGFAFDSKGNLAVADASNNRVQTWGQPSMRSELETELKVDGKEVKKWGAGCGSEYCNSNQEWSFAYPEYQAGEHTLAVKATDGLGNTTTKTTVVHLTPDTTKPTLEVTGSLFNAPEGWVEQEGYGLSATATDQGSGVTNLDVKIDGQEVAGNSETCPAGACPSSLGRTLNMAEYAGGAHEAEVTAADGRGNSVTRKWTINVDPDGHIAASEAIDTLEAADVTSNSSVVAATSEVLDPQQMEGGDNPGLRLAGEVLESTGVPDPTKMGVKPEAGFTIETPEGTFSVTPAVAEEPSNTVIAEKVAGVAANVGSEVDSVIRPEYNGDQTFQDIRSSTAQHVFSWAVTLGRGQELKLLDEHDAAVKFSDGEVGMLISAEPAHDAVGTIVPTSLSVTGNTLTLSVDAQSADYVYPVVSGQGWQGGYPVPTIIEGPEDEIEIMERERRELEEEIREREEEWEAEGAPGSEPPAPPLHAPPFTYAEAKAYLGFGLGDGDVQAAPRPNPGTPPGSHISTLYRSKCGHSCDWFKARVYNAAIITGPQYNWSKWEDGTQVHADVVKDPLFEVPFQSTTWNCGWRGPWVVQKGSGEHLIAFAHFTIEFWWVPPVDAGMFPAEVNWGFQAWVYPNGFQEKHVRASWNGEPVSHECPTTIAY